MKPIFSLYVCLMCLVEGDRVGAGESSVGDVRGGVRADGAVTSQATEEKEETMETELGH